MTSLMVITIFLLLFVISIESCINYGIPKANKFIQTDRIKKSLKSLSIALHVLTSSTQKSFGKDNNEKMEYSIDFPLDEAVNIIKNNCKTVLQASQSTGRLLYRGSSSIKQVPQIVFSKPDLLLKGTYSPLGTDFFSCIDNYIVNRTNINVYPANGHIATSNLLTASNWGVPMSIWPFDNLHYMWLKKDLNWWNEEDWSNLQGSRPPLFWRNNTFLDDFFIKEIQYDKGLEGALAKGSEIMFTSTPTVSNLKASNIPSIKPYIEQSIRRNLIHSGDYPQFLAVPLILERQLTLALGIKPYSESISIKTLSSVTEINDDETRMTRLDTMSSTSSLLYDPSSMLNRKRLIKRFPSEL